MVQPQMDWDGPGSVYKLDWPKPNQCRTTRILMAAAATAILPSLSPVCSEMEEEVAACVVIEIASAVPYNVGMGK